MLIQKEKTHTKPLHQFCMCSVHGYESINTLVINYIISGLENVRSFSKIIRIGVIKY